MTVDVKIDLNACTKCGICTLSCPQDVIREKEDKEPYIAYIEDCTGCRLCQISCPVEAVNVIGGTSWKYDDVLMMGYFLEGLGIKYQKD